MEDSIFTRTPITALILLHGLLAATAMAQAPAGAAPEDLDARRRMARETHEREVREAQARFEHAATRAAAERDRAKQQALARRRATLIQLMNQATAAGHRPLASEIAEEIRLLDAGQAGPVEGPVPVRPPPALPAEQRDPGQIRTELEAAEQKLKELESEIYTLRGQLDAIRSGLRKDLTPGPIQRRLSQAVDEQAAVRARIAQLRAELRAAPKAPVELLGVVAQGAHFVIVCGDGLPFNVHARHLEQRLADFVNLLPPTSTISLITHRRGEMVVWRNSMVPANDVNKHAFADSIQSIGETARYPMDVKFVCPLPAIRRALAMRNDTGQAPDAIFLISGGYCGAVGVDNIVRSNRAAGGPARTPIHVIVTHLRPTEGETSLRKLSEQAGGSFRLVAHGDLRR